MLNTIENLIHIMLGRKTKKIIVIGRSDDDEGNKKRMMRKRENAESVKTKQSHKFLFHEQNPKRKVKQK